MGLRTLRFYIAMFCIRPAILIFANSSTTISDRRYCGIIFVCGGPMFLAFVGNLCNINLHPLERIYKYLFIVFTYKLKIELATDGIMFP